MKTNKTVLYRLNRSKLFERFKQFNTSTLTALDAIYEEADEQVKLNVFHKMKKFLNGLIQVEFAELGHENMRSWDVKCEKQFFKIISLICKKKNIILVKKLYEINEAHKQILILFWMSFLYSSLTTTLI